MTSLNENKVESIIRSKPKSFMTNIPELANESKYSEPNNFSDNLQKDNKNNLNEFKSEIKFKSKF